MLVHVGNDILPGVSVLLYCTHCTQLQRKGNGVCPWCAADIDRIRHCRIVPTQETKSILLRIRQGCRLPLSPSHTMPEASGPTIQQRVGRAKQQGVCAPLVPGALYWDVPGTVGKLDGVKHRHAYMDVDDEPLEVFRLETGLAGRLFVQPGAFVTWAKKWHQGANIIMHSTAPDPWLEVMLRPAQALALWTYDSVLMQDCLAFDVLEQLPGRLPILGFEWGVTRVLPDSYKATCEMGLSLDGSNPALRLTWGTTNYMITNGEMKDFRALRQLAAEAIRRQYPK